MIATKSDVERITIDLIKNSYYHAYKLKHIIHADIDDISQELVARTIAAIYKQPAAIQKAVPETFKSHSLSLMFYITKSMKSAICENGVSRKKQRADSMCYSKTNIEDSNKEFCLDEMPSSTVKGEDSKHTIIEYEQSKYTDANSINLRLDIENIKSKLNPKEAQVVELLELGYDGRVINKILGVSHNYVHFMLNNIRSRLKPLKEIQSEQLTFNTFKYNIGKHRGSHDSLTEFNGGCKMATDKKTAAKKPVKKTPAKTVSAKKVAPAKKDSAKAPVAKASRSELVANFVQPMLDKGKMTRREIADKVAAKFDLTPSTAYIYVSKLAVSDKPAKKAPAKTAPKAPAKKPAPEKKAPAKKPAKPVAKSAPKSKAKAKKAADEDDLADPFEDDSDAEDDFDPEADV